MGSPSITPTIEKLSNTAIASIPVIGPIISSIAGVVEGFFGASHAAAVTKEAQVLNGAQPAFLQTVQAIMKAASSGAIAPAQAIAALQQAQANYYTAVASIIKKGGPCRPPSLVSQPTCNGALNCCIYTEDWADCASAGDCNASCAIACGMVEPTVTYLSTILAAGKGTFTIPASKQNGAIAGLPAITIQYTEPSVLTKIEIGILGFIDKL